MRLGPRPVVIASLLALAAGGLLLSDRRPSADPEGEVEALREDAQRGLAASALQTLERKRERLLREGPKSMNKPQEAQQFFVEQRLLPGETRLPLDRLRVELAAIREREAGVQAAGTSPGGVLGWNWLGPGNIGGRTRALVIDPNDADIMYAAGVAGGIWKSTDGGASWNPADDFMLNLAVVSLAMDPTDSSVLYAGTGEGWFYANVFVEGLGIFKSTDAGATWSQLPGTVSGVPAGAFSFVNDLVISPLQPNVIYAGTRTGVWRSTDSGTSWSAVLKNPSYLAGSPATNGSLIGCTDLAVRGDVFPEVVFAAFGSSEADGLFRSLDGGNTWQAYLVPPNQGRMSIALAPSDNDVMYLLMADNGSGGALGQLVSVFRSDDGGDSFTAQVDLGSKFGPWLLSNAILATGCVEGGTYSQGWYDNILAVDPVDPDIVWVGGVDMFRSDDGGVNWGLAAYWFYYQEDPPPPFQLHPDHHRIVFHPDYDGAGNQTMYFGNDGGLFKTENARAATTQDECPLQGPVDPPQLVFERLNNGYGVTQFYHGDSGSKGQLYVAGAQDNGTNRAQSAFAPDEWDLIFGGDGGYVAIDPKDNDVMYIEYHEFPTIMKSTDGGDTFVEAVSGITDTDGIFITPFAMDPGDPDVLWTGGRRPWRTTDGAATWELAGPNLSAPNSISAIAVSPSDGNVVYLGFTNGYGARSTNALSASPNWSAFQLPVSGGWISSIGVHPGDPDIAYATSSTYGVNHITKTLNGGANWSSVDGIGAAGVPDIPCHWVAVRPCRPEHVFVASELGVFASEDGGGTWAPANLGLANTVVESLDFQGPNVLVAFTHGRGAYLTPLQPCPDGPQVRSTQGWPPPPPAGDE